MSSIEASRLAEANEPEATLEREYDFR
jgi:hypothetical protein